MIDATAIILTKNEEVNIQACLSSAAGFAKRMVVVDCGSTDNTVALARQLGAEVYEHAFEYYARQFNWALQNTGITTQWVIRLDADETLPPALCRELEQIITQNSGNQMNGIAIQADLFFLGRCLKYGPRKKRKLMLFKTAFGQIEDRKRDAHSVISQGYSVFASQRFIHRDIRSLDDFIRRYAWYATREMQDYLAYEKNAAAEAKIKTEKVIGRHRQRKFGLYYKAPMYLRAWLWFLYNYIFRLGILDGRSGFLYCYFECYWYRMLVDAKILEQRQKGGAFETLRMLE